MTVFLDGKEMCSRRGLHDHLKQNGFTDEEHKLYRKYTTDGRRLVAQLQEKTSGGRRRGSAAQGEFPTENIPWLMLRESCEQHMERWVGCSISSPRRFSLARALFACRLATSKRPSVVYFLYTAISSSVKSLCHV